MSGLPGHRFVEWLNSVMWTGKGYVAGTGYAHGCECGLDLPRQRFSQDGQRMRQYTAEDDYELHLAEVATALGRRKWAEQLLSQRQQRDEVG